MAKKKRLSAGEEQALEEGQSISKSVSRRTQTKRATNPVDAASVKAERALEKAADELLRAKEAADKVHQSLAKEQLAVIAEAGAKPTPMEAATATGQKTPNIQSAVEKLRLARTAAKSAESAKLEALLSPFSVETQTAGQLAGGIAPAELAMARTAPELEAQLAAMVPAAASGAGGGSVPPVTPPVTAAPAAIPGAVPSAVAAGKATAVPKTGMWQKAGGLIKGHPYLALLSALGLGGAWYLSNQSAKAKQSKEAEEFARQMALSDAARSQQADMERESMNQALAGYLQSSMSPQVSPYLQQAQEHARQQDDYLNRLNEYLSQFSNPGY